MTFPAYNPVMGGTHAQDLAAENAPGHVLPGSVPPTAGAGANNGTSPPAPVVGGNASDNQGSLTFGSGSAPAAGAQCVVTFNKPFQVAPIVLLTATTAALAALGLCVTSVTTTGFTVSTNSAPAASQAATVYGVAWRAQ